MDVPSRAPAGIPGVWGVKAPAPKVRKYEQYRVTPGHRHPLVIVSRHMVTNVTHYWQAKTWKCSDETGRECWLPHHLSSTVWNGWLACIIPGTWKPWLVHLTKCAAHCDPRLLDETVCLRGRHIELGRLGEKANAEMAARLTEEFTDEVSLPIEPNVQFLVNRMLEAPKKNGKDFASAWCAARAAEKGGS